MDETVSPYVETRHVIHIGGFDPVDPQRLAHRMDSGLRKFAALWGITAQSSAPELSANGRVLSWQVEARGPNWSTDTDYTILRWDELIAPYFAQVWWLKIISGFAALLHFTLNGTIWRYLVTNARYGMFVLYPFFLLIGITALAIYIGKAIAGVDLPYSSVFGVLGGVGLFIGLLRWSGGYFHLYFALADWSLAADMVRGRMPGLEVCLEHFAEEIVARVRKAEYDEVILSGVSLGAVMMVEALARVLAREPDFCRDGPPIALLTIGSSILKIGLHPGAAELKSAVGRVSRQASLFWIEYQSKVDPLNFYKTDPVARMGLPATGKPFVQTIRIRETLIDKEYRQLKMNFLRLHRQFAMPNTRRYFYDYYLICFGPMALAERAALRRRATAAIGEDGRYLAIRPDANDDRAAVGTP